MADNVKKDINDTKISTDTLFVLLLVICGIAVIILAAYLLYKPHQGSNDVVIRDIIVSGAIPNESESVQSVEDSLKNSYLVEPTLDEEKKEEPKLEESIEDETLITKKDQDLPVIKDKPIFKKSTTTPVLKQTVTKTTVVKPKKVQQKLVTIKAYWIQVGSFSSSAQANKSVDLLKSKGLSSRVVLKSVNGKSVYRVRIGAYESKDEADKFLSEVQKIDGYSGSYVSESTTQKYIDI
ncbi:SPOR domain-containing protein [Thiospirochaeta perfilievii]|uniref:SPOR domain-containing protein n=1 Tax=Thiospirochaeta perfilievii TaxID=252967 RepID=A0A5C1QC74_9SPIO|nr:SPOR domain-containing protein [Thiospirochaeta perfilievii]QEN05705.1 SPOR domain-containing protein [Thiospirochaeta perfilievii]